MNLKICAFGTAPDQASEGFQLVGLELTGTDESVLKCLTHAGDVRLVRGPMLYGTNEQLFYVLKKSESNSKSTTKR